MIRTAKLYQRQVTLGELKAFIAEADAIGATDDQQVTIRQAQSYANQLDPGGEITIEVSVRTPNA